MKFFRIALTLGLIATTVVLVSSQEYEEYDFEGEAAPQPPQPPQRGRSPLLASRQNKASPLIGNANKISKQSGVGAKAAAAAKAAPPPPPPPPEPQEEDIAEYDEDQEEPVEQTSTEAPKKTIKPIVRPFRSNDDLLAALKRRRQQVQNSGGVVEKTTTTTSAPPAPANHNKKSSNSFGYDNRRNRSGGGGRGAAPQPQDDFTSEADTGKKSGSRKYNNRSGTRSAPAPVLEDIPVEDQPKPKFGRGSRRPS